jgi:SAM-dependent methyltransferase
MAACTRRTTCRLCGSQALDLVLALEPTPPANAFVAADAVGKDQERFPLDVFLCRSCGHAQLLDVVDPSLLFENYVYVSGTSPVFVRHFEEYAADVIGRFAPPAGGLVVDIGSNDGTLLGFFQRAGYRVLGVDPARAIAERATAAGIETLSEFFTPERALAIRKERGPAAVVTANNVFAHADDLKGIVEGVRTLLDPRTGVYVFEVSYLVDVYEKTLFDTIYHEHVAYHAVTPLVAFFERAGMQLIDVLRVPSHGGSIRVVVQPAGASRAVAPSVAAALSLEDRLGVTRPEAFHVLSSRIQERKAALATLLSDLKRAGRRIAGYGAPAKATTLMHHFALGGQALEYVVDDSPLKQGLFTPGLHVPVVPAVALVDRRPDYLVVLAWNFAPSILEKLASYRNGGGRVIVPLPNVEIH